jgi:hypothetical protein
MASKISPETVENQNKLPDQPNTSLQRSLQAFFSPLINSRSLYPGHCSGTTKEGSPFQKWPFQGRKEYAG